MTVGELLWKLAQYHQVMCVTHLPQLAFGDQHLRVNKLTDQNRTTQVTELEDWAHCWNWLRYQAAPVKRVYKQLMNY